MFDARVDTLVQFRLPPTWVLPESVRNYGIESQGERNARMRHADDLGSMESIIERNGASLAKALERITSAGLRLVDAYAQTRTTPPSEFRWKERPYKLLTFVFRSAGAEKRDVRPLFDSMAESRWEYVSIRARLGNDRPLLCVVAKTQAQAAVMLQEVPDSEAEPFGIVVSKSVRRENRQKKK